MYVDIHCHLSFPEFDVDRKAVIERMKDAGVSLLVDPGTNVATTRRSIALAQQHDFIFANVGLHPGDLHDMPDDSIFDELATLACDQKVVGIGEIGLDYHWPGYNRNVQIDTLREMLRMAQTLDLPVVIHCRDAWPDMLQVLSEERSSSLRGAMHCFSGDLEIARQCIKLGLKISIPGTITYRKSELPVIVAALDATDLLSETDSPYLAPVPMRGKRNEPALIVRTVEAMATARGEPLETLSAQLEKNARTLFGLI